VPQCAWLNMHTKAKEYLGIKLLLLYISYAYLGVRSSSRILILTWPHPVTVQPHLYTTSISSEIRIPKYDGPIAAQCMPKKESERNSKAKNALRL
jgi:hypothetical protein